MTTLQAISTTDTDHAEPNDQCLDAEIELIEQARTDPRAFGRLYREHYVPIVGYLYRRTGDRHEAEDLAGAVFLAAWRALPRYRIGRAPFRSWLYRIATNAANRWARRQQRRRALLGSAREKWIERDGRTDHADDAEEALRALHTLTPAHQAVLCLHHVEGLSVEVLADVLGCRPGTVKSRLSRARTAYRRELQRRLDHD
jgi:RNA polymerase sigma-70 factor (ECF subfamily)